MTDDLAERHVYGRADAPITVLEFGDLECPYCRAAAPALRELVDTSDGRVRLVWRHFPLFEVHPYALSAALAAEAAGVHGQVLGDARRADEPPGPAGRARTCARPRRGSGSTRRRSRATARRCYAAAISADYTAGIEAGVRGTPTIFVDGDAVPREGDAGAAARGVEAMR